MTAHKSDRQIGRLLADAVELLARADGALLPRLAAMTDAMHGHPASAKLDGGGGSKATFCEVHGKERCECGGGTPYENVSDPTGEAALRKDGAASDRLEFQRAVELIGRQAEVVIRLLARYTPRMAGELEDRDAGLGDPGCWSCARVARWAPPWRRVDLPSGTSVQVCRWCYDWARDVGEAPSASVLKLHWEGKTVRRPVTKRVAS